MAAQSRPGIERLKAKRLGLRRVDDFEDIDVHARAELFQLVYQRNIH